MEDRAVRAHRVSDLREPVLSPRPLLAAGLLSAALPIDAQTMAEPTLLPEVAVSAGAEAIEARHHAATGRIVLGREDIEAMDAASIGDLLRKLPGTGLAADLEGKRGRGKGPDRFMPTILVDGEPLPGGDRNPATVLRLAPELIERIELIRGASAEYPAAGPGGIVNLVLRDVPPRPGGSLRGGLGSQGGEPVLRLDGQHGQRQAGFGWLLAGSAHSRPLAADRTTDSQRFAAGARSAWTVERSTERGREDAVTFAPRADWRLADGSRFILSPFLAASRERRDSRTAIEAFADPLAGTDPAAAGGRLEGQAGDRDSWRLAVEWRAGGAAAGAWAEMSLRATVQGEREGRRQDRLDHDAAGVPSGRRSDDEERREREVGLAFKGKRLWHDNHLVGLGAELRLKTGDERQAAAVDGSAVALGAAGAARQRERRVVLWAQDEWQLADGHLLTAGVRWQSWAGRATDGLGAAADRTSRAANPTLHYLWQPAPAWNLRASLARDRKAPGLKDMSAVARAAAGANSSANPDKGGNPALLDQDGTSLDLGVEHFFAGRAGSAGLSLFRRRIGNQVQKLTRLEGGRWVERPYNVGTALLSGGVADLKWRLDALALPALTVRANLALTRTRLSEPVVTGAGEGPRRSWNLGFDYEPGDGGLSFGGNLGAVSALDRESSAAIRQTQGARRQLDLYARQRIDRSLAWRLSIGNAGGPDRLHQLSEADAAGQLLRLENDRETTAPLLFLALESRW